MKRYFILSFLLVSFVLCGVANGEECTEPYENMYVNSNTFLCSGTYYLNDADTNGVVIINASNIILDCNGAVFKGNRTALSMGIINGLGNDNVTVKNCINEDYYIGIYFYDTVDSSVINNKVLYSMREGITLDRSENNSLINNTAVETYGGGSWPGGSAGSLAGIFIDRSNRTSLINNTAVNSTDCLGIYISESLELTTINNIAENNENGFDVYASTGTMEENTAENNLQAGFLLIATSYMKMVNNTASKNLIGIGIQGNHLALEENTVDLNVGGGIGLIQGTLNTSLVGEILNGAKEKYNLTHNSTWCTNITLKKNEVNSSSIIPYYFPSGVGIGLEECKNITVEDNFVSHHEYAGIGLLESENNSILGNELSENTVNGGIVLLVSDNTNVYDNKARNNTYGVYLEYSYQNTIDSNEISENTEDGIKLTTSGSVDVTSNNVTLNQVGIRVISSSNFNILNNSLANNYQEDILIDPSSNFQIMNNEITNSGFGIKLIETTNSNISENLVEFNYIGANIIDSSNFDLINNTFSNNTEANLIIDPSSNFKLIENLISTSNFGLKIIDSVGGVILRNLFQYNNYGIDLNSSDVVINDSRVSDSNFYDMGLENSNNTLTNTTFDTEKVNISGSSSMSVSWLLDTRIFEIGCQNPIQNAIVVGYDNYNNLVFNLSSDFNGDIPIQELLEYIQNSTDKVFYSPYIIHAEKEDFVTEILVIDLNESMDIDVVLSDNATASDIDIDPDTINLGSKGKFIRAFIEVPGYDVSEIDIDTVRIDKTVNAINDTKYGFVKDPTIEDRDDDGLPEFMAVFYRSEVIEILDVGENTLMLSGDIADTGFMGNDTITVID